MFWNFKNIVENDKEIELNIIGEIMSDDEAWLADFFGTEATTPNLFKNELAQHAGKSITVWIDSPGGNVFAGAGIYNALQEHKKTGSQITAKIKFAGSSASVIAMAADQVMMSPVGIMAIHNPYGQAEGDARKMMKFAGILDEIKQTLVNAYELKTGKSRSKISQMMDDETWMGAKKAQQEGFSDGTLYADTTIQNKATENMLGFFDKHPELFNRAVTQPVVDIEKLQRQKQEFDRIRTKLQGGN